MDKSEADQEGRLTLFKKLVILFVFLSLIITAIYYFNESEPDSKYRTLENLQQRFSQSATNAHWQWQAEGRPRMIILIHYEPNFDNNERLVEKDRRPIMMNTFGYPSAELSADGCAKLWSMIINMPLEIEGFKVFPEFFAATSSSQAKCRYRLSVGPYFEYTMATGQVSSITR